MNSLKDWVSKARILKQSLKKIDSAALWGGRQYVAAVDPLDENEVFLEKSIGLLALGNPDLKVVASFQ